MIRHIFLILLSILSVIRSFHQISNKIKNFRYSMNRSSLPPPLTSDIEGIIDDNAEELTKPSSPLRSECLLLLNDLKASLMCGTGGYLRGISDKGPDLAIWDKILSDIPDDKRNWLNAPWVVSEFYFYRRIAEAFKYFETGYDMFTKQKLSGLIECIPFVNDVTTQLSLLLQNPKTDVSIPLEMAIFTSLWGNKMDLSLWPTSTRENNCESDNTDSETGKISDTSKLSKIRSFILDDHTSDVMKLLINSDNNNNNSNNKREVGIVVDNAGYELVSDLLLGYTLIKLNLADVITFHTKGHPTFVSDATTDDLIYTIDYLSKCDNKYTSDFGKELLSFLENNKFQAISDIFWCQPTAFWDMPEYIKDKLSNSKLVFVKGDANYRRLLGERAWPLDTKASNILNYWHVPVCALRTFKAEIGCGISEETIARVESQDKNWMVSGKWGVVQLGGV